jgi:hypothetical protein
MEPEMLPFTSILMLNEKFTLLFRSQKAYEKSLLMYITTKFTLTNTKPARAITNIMLLILVRGTVIAKWHTAHSVMTRLQSDCNHSISITSSHTMANVNLNLTEEATGAFLAAQEDKSIRSLVLDIVGEDIVLKSTQAGSSDVTAG